MPRSATILIVLLFAATPGLRGQSPRPASASDLRESIDRLATVGSVLYVAAHPDDENTAFLATMAHGRNVRAAYLSITRGEGGQNLIGPEQGDLLGMIRTQELLAARSIDGGEQFFTRAIDFGYSKTSEETLRFWGREEIVSDIVRVIRRFRPDVIVTRFTPELGGHGNHTASASLTIEAVQAAGDRARYVDQLATLEAWSPRRLVWNVFRQAAASPEPGTVSVDLGAYDPIIGRSYTELAGEARTMHKSQGFGAAQNRSSALNSFQHIWGDSARNDLFDGIDLTWRRLPGGDRVQPLIDSLRSSFDDRQPARSVPRLLQIREAIDALPDGIWKARKMTETDDLILACAGLWIDALADRPVVVAGDSLVVTLSAVNRSDLPIRIEAWRPDGIAPAAVTPVRLEPFIQRALTLRGIVPRSAANTQPYWLVAEHTPFRYVIPDPHMIGMPDHAPSFTATVDLEIRGVRIRRLLPLRYRQVDPVDGEVYRPVTVTTPVHVTFSDPVHVFRSDKPQPIALQVRAVRAVGPVAIRLELPAGWRSEPASRTISQLEAHEVRAVTFHVRPSDPATSGSAYAAVEVEGKSVRTGIAEASYEHIPRQILHVTAQTKLLPIPVSVTARTVGYVMGAGDGVSDGLRRLGCRVELLHDDTLTSGDLGTYDAIVIGVRAYNTRPALRAVKERLAAYARNGGTVVVQYQTTARGESDDIAPVPLTIGRERVTEEDAPIRVLDPKHRVMTRPNRITPDDFAGWVQERGLYFASSWGPEFVPILGSNDAGEPSRDGGLLVAKMGKGYYVYTGLSFFRQIPMGVPGAYRLLANLVSLGRP